MLSSSESRGCSFFRVSVKINRELLGLSKTLVLISLGFSSIHSSEPCKNGRYFVWVSSAVCIFSATLYYFI